MMLSFRLSHAGKPLIARVGTGAPVVRMVYEYGLPIMAVEIGLLINAGIIRLSPLILMLSNRLFPLVLVLGAVKVMRNTSLLLLLTFSIELRSRTTFSQFRPAESNVIGSPAVVKVAPLSRLYANSCLCWPLAVLDDCVS